MYYFSFKLNIAEILENITKLTKIKFKMENKAYIFYSFALTSVTMPYYGSTHKVFLLLSSLCTKSRMKLDEFYEEFRKIMAEFSKEIDINDMNSNLLALPWDLFKFNFVNKPLSPILAQNLIELIENITSLKGRYFNAHFMHKLLNISDIQLNKNSFENMFPYADKMKLIYTFNNSSSLVKTYFKSNLKDKLIMKVNEIFRMYSGKSKLILFEDIVGWDEALNKFNRIDWYIATKSKDIAKDYKVISKYSLLFDTYHLDWNSIENIDSFLNSDFLKGRIKHLILSSKNNTKISSKALQNINEIKPVVFRLICQSKLINQINYSDLLAKLNNNIDLDIKYINCKKWVKLVFNDAFMKIIELDSK